MNWINRRDIKLFLLTVLPIVVAALGMQWSTTRMLDGIKESVDQQEAARTWQAVRSAFSAIEERLVGTVTDNAHWDDAVQESYGQLDPKWMFDTWGVATSDINYDTMYLVDPRGEPLVAYRLGEQFATSPKVYFGKTLDLLLQSLPGNNKDFETIGTLVETPDGIAVMAAAPILPTSEGMAIPSNQPNVLILARSITADVLKKMGEQYIVDRLELLPATATSSAHSLTDRWNRPVANVTWQERSPGNAVRRSYSLSAVATIVALILVMIPISLVHARTMARMDRREKDALVAARHDTLSGLPNRTFLLDELTSRLPNSPPDQLSLIFVDLDGFKAVNDAYDHETGDKLIQLVSLGLTQLVTNHGSLARLGGDEFAILVSGPESPRCAQKIADRILEFVKQPFNIDGRIANIGASIGIADVAGEQLDPAELMRRADIAMYEAKDCGRNQWRRFERTLDLKRSEDIAIANELRSILANSALDVAYQPMVDSRTRTVIGVEVLARWPQSSPRQIPPSRFIPVAEEFGLIDGLGALVLDIASRDLAQWQDLVLAVNISPAQIDNPNLVNEIKRITTMNRFPLDRLEVELTEGVLIRNPKRAKLVIDELKACGATIALDDFGTGYASVGYLREYAFDKIKLDRSLTKTITTSSATQQVVTGTILIAKGLSANVIAEGVETEEECKLMRLAGCQQMQGYYFGKPTRALSVSGQTATKAFQASA